MLGIKRNKHRNQSAISTPSPKSSQKLFVGYPYPIIAELNKTYKQPKKSNCSCALGSLQWCKDSFHKVFGILHNLHGHNSQNAIIEQSFQQAHTDRRLSKIIVDDLQQKPKPTRVKRVLASSLPPPLSDTEGQNPVRYLRRRYTINSTHPINDDPG